MGNKPKEILHGKIMDLNNDGGRIELDRAPKPFSNLHGERKETLYFPASALEGTNFNDLAIGTRLLIEGIEASEHGPRAYGVKIDDKEMMGKYLGVGEAEANEIDTNTYHGTIEELHDQGWGKIKSDDRNIFFNSSALKGATFDELEIGKKVLFNIVNFDKNGVGKIKAARVQIANKEKENSFRGGVIKTLHERGGKIDFAFIMPEDGGKDIMFVPLRPEDEKALSELERGASVLFEPIMSPKVLKAKTIRIGDKVIMGTVPRETL